MRKRRVLVFLLALVVSLIVVVSALHYYFFRFGSIGFVSIRKDYKWDPNWKNVEIFEDITGNYDTFLGKVFVLLHSDMRETDLSASAFPKSQVMPSIYYENLIPLFYGEWDKVGPFDVLNIYPVPENIEIIYENDPSLPNYILSNYINNHFINRFTIPRDAQGEMNAVMVSEGEIRDYIFGIVKE